MDIGKRNHWKLHHRPYHADDHTVGQFYLALYEDYNDPAMLEPLRKQFDWIMQNRKIGTLDWEAKNTHAHDRWGWADALFMAPPVWARLAKVTGDSRYLEFMDQEYHVTYDLLWNKKDHLFWRDSSYFTQKEQNGQDIYWARGNGWVFGGLALMIPDLPSTWEEREFYITTFKQMAARLKEIQRNDGTWSMGLLGGTESYPIKETSGTSFFVFGLAWGINQGILDRATYEPVILRAWAALSAAVTEDGMLGYVQPVGAAPGDSFPDYTEVYGVGALLAAGSELYKLLQPQASPAPAADIRTFMYNSGWCWFQDPCAIIHNDQLIIGGVAGNGRGEAAAGVYDLNHHQRLGRVTLHQDFDRDDHNSPVFYARPDGSLLTLYARHSTENRHYYRVSGKEDYLHWGEEKTIEHQDPATYMNPHYLSDDKTLYNFFRGIEWNPTLVTSNDHGDSWNKAQHFIQSEVNGRQRPYVRYASNGKDTIAITFTDAHPRDYGNSLYYAEFRAGNFYKADGSFIKNLTKDGPLKPSEAEKIFTGGQGGFRGFELSAQNSAWTSDIVLDRAGKAHIAYSLYLSNNDLRYRVAQWDGKRWVDREVAYAGTRLYEREASYTGLISFDPTNPNTLVLSSDVNPANGADIGGKHQIFTATLNEQDTTASINWTQLTFDTLRDNIRPIVAAADNHKVILWLRGQYRSYTDYNLDAVGIQLN